MNLPILERLKDGIKFDYETLEDNYDGVEAFWEWWWEKADLNTISRPETIVATDPILMVTADKEEVDLCSYSHFFNQFLTNMIESGALVPGMSRAKFREQITRIIGGRSVKSQSQPELVFAGGGYGSGKTFTIGLLAENGKLPLDKGCMIGVDYFKLYLPEFSLIQRVADGRASMSVQKECQKLCADLFPLLIQELRSFIFDSSMSDVVETLSRIKAAKQKGYNLTMVAVLTPLAVAIKQAMRRAKEWRRFPHKDFLPKSHIDFRKALMGYIPHFTDVSIYGNIGDGEPVLLAEKNDGKELAILDEHLFNELRSWE